MVAKLKENKIYNYGYFFKPEIRVFANEKTINLIKGVNKYPSFY